MERLEQNPCNLLAMFTPFSDPFALIVGKNGDFSESIYINPKIMVSYFCYVKLHFVSGLSLDTLLSGTMNKEQ